MTDPDTSRRIIASIQDHLLSEHLQEIDAVEAAKVLDRRGVLSDSSDRPGLMLRVYLREGLVEGAAEDAYGRWYISRVQQKWTPPSSLESIWALRQTG